MKTSLPDDAAEVETGINNPLLDHIGFLLRRAQVAVFDDFSKRMSACQLRPGEYSLLQIVGQNPGIRQARVSELLDIKAANLSPLVGAIEARGLLQREKPEDDKRASSLFLSQAGSDLLREAEIAAEAHLSGIRALTGKSDYDGLLSHLRRLVAALDSRP